MQNRPNVFPSNSEQPKENKLVTPQLSDNKQITGDSDYERNKLNEANQIYDNTMNETGWSAIEEMRKRTEEQMKLRDEALRKNKEQTDVYQQQFAVAKERKITTESSNVVTESPRVKSVVLEPKKEVMTSHDTYIQALSQPQFNMSFDVIPLPSEGKIYGLGKSSFKVAYMTTADENILTSPNLLESGEFLEILINRKLLENGIRYKDLHVGDRNAIMLWLRATSYGEMYPVTLLDEENEPFDTEINLNELKTKKLGAEPDENGFFDFVLPIAKDNIKFKLLTVGDLEEIEKLVEEDKINEVPVNNVNTYTLEKQIVSVNQITSKDFIKDYVNTLRIRDAKELKEYINKIDSGIDLQVEVKTPRGGVIKTFLPLNIKFFWPNISI
jgi:hypothetical protein